MTARNPRLRTAASLLVVLSQFLLMVPGGTASSILTKFSDGSPDGIAVFGPAGGNATPLNLSLPASALVLNASLTLEGLPSAMSGERTDTTDEDFGMAASRRNITISDGKVGLASATGGWSQSNDSEFRKGSVENLAIDQGVRLARGPKFGVAVGEYLASSSCRTQSRPAAVLDSKGDLVLAWEDLRNGTSLDIYCRRFDPSGNPLGPETVVCDAPRHQYNPAVAVDKGDGFVVVWQDGRTGDFDILGRKFDASGNPAGPEFAVCNADGDQSRPSACFGLDNKLLVVWDDYRDGRNYGIYSILLDNSGAQSGMETPLGRGITDRLAASACALPKGYAVAWQNLSNVTGMDLEGAILSDAGEPGTGFIVSGAPGNQSAIRLGSGQGGNFAAVWQDMRGADFDVHGQWFDSDGRPSGAETPICFAPGDQRNPALSVRTAGDSLVAWEDYRGGNASVHFKRFSSLWNSIGTENIASDGKADQMAPAVALDASGGSVAAWSDWRDGLPNIMVKKFGQPRYVYSTGMLVSPVIPSFAATYGSVGLCITLPRTPRSPYNTTGFDLLILDGRLDIVLQSGCIPGDHVMVNASEHASIRLAIYLWTRDENITPVFRRWSVGTGIDDDLDVANGGAHSGTRAKNGSVLLQSTGNPETITNDVPVKDGSTFDYSVSVAKYPDESYVATWREGNGPLADILARRFARDGTPLTPDISVCAAAGLQEDPAVAADLNGHFTVVWSDNRSGLDCDVYARRFDANGNPLGSEILVCGTATDQRTPAIATDLDNNFIVVWVDWSRVFSLLYMQKFGPDGVPTSDFVKVVWTQYSLLLPSVATDSQNRIILTWSDFRAAGTGGDYDIYGAIFDSRCEPVYIGKEIDICVKPGDQYSAALAVEPDDTFIVAWEDRSNYNDFQIYGRKYDREGKPLTSEFPIATATGDQGEPAIATDSSGNFLAAWQTIGDGFDINGRYFGSNGAPLSSEFLICSVKNVAGEPSDQMHPAIACGPDDEFVVAWVDNRPKYDMDLWAKCYGFPRHVGSGTYTTPAYDLVHTPLSLDEAGYGSQKPSGTSITAQLRTSADGSAWAAWEPAIESQSSFSSPPGRFIQWQFTLGTTNVLNTPQLQGLYLRYTTYATNGTLISQPIDARFHISELVVSWVADETGGELKLQATADNGTTWMPCVQGVPLVIPSGGESSIIRYRAFLYSTGSGTPLLDEVALTYSALSLPFDPYLDLGGDGAIEWNLSGEFDDSLQVQGLEDALNGLLANAGSLEGTLQVPVLLHSASGGRIRVSNLTVSYDAPPVILASFPSSTEPSMNETEHLRFSVTAKDPDGDELTYIWTLNGRVVGNSGPDYDFKTDYSSSGNYSVAVSVSDQYFSVNRTWRVNVLDLNRPPLLDWYPRTDLTINEADKASFWVAASDPDGANVSIGWYLDGKLASDNATYELITDYNSSGAHIVSVKVSDGIDTVQHNWTVTVLNKNRAPVILRQWPAPETVLRLKVGNSQDFRVDAFDPDGDRLVYVWKLNGQVLPNEFGLCYTCRKGLVVGANTVRVEVSDGNATASTEWNLHMSAPPVIKSSSGSSWAIGGVAVIVMIVIVAVFFVSRRKRPGTGPG